MKNATWTEERRLKQAEIIRKNRPWEKSTGPKTRKGKKRSSLNALKHGARGSSSKHVRKSLRLNREFLKHIELFYIKNALEMRMTNELIENRLKSKTMAPQGKNSGERTIEKNDH